MRTTRLHRKLAALSIALLAATPAFAHPGHGENAGFAGGLVHPLTGLDHLAAMLMVGIWAARLRVRAAWLAPLAFIVPMMLGFAAAQWPARFAAETIIVVSLAVLPLLIVFAKRLPLTPQFGCVLFFGFAHGFAHGRDGGASLDFFYGMALATAVLHAAGYGIATLAMARPRSRLQA